MTAIVEAIERHAAEKPSSVAVSDELGAWSFAELRGAVSGLAGQLASLFEGSSRPVAVRLPNSAVWVAVDLALSQIGCVSVPIADFYTDEQVAATLVDSGAGWII